MAVTACGTGSGIVTKETSSAARTPNSRMARISSGGRRRELDGTDVPPRRNVGGVEFTTVADGWFDAREVVRQRHNLQR
jgi:hypothetical protein